MEIIRIMLVDDEPQKRASLKTVLTRKSHIVKDFGNGIDALNAINKGEVFSNAIDLAIIDQKMPRMDGFEFAKQLKSIAPNAILVMLTAYASINDTVEAIRGGFYDYWEKGKDDIGEELERNLSRVRGVIEERDRTLKRSQALAHNEDPDEIVYISNGFQGIMEQVDEMSGTDISVLITGDTGTGKTMIARRIHKNSKRSQVPLKELSITNFPDSLIEGQLFGYKKGAFTGAVKEFKGYFKLADNGTLFLDEVGEIPLEVQKKLLTVLETKKFYSLSGDKEESSDFRIISATNLNLEEQIKSTKFREDLYYRIAQTTINIPPLRDRIEDIPILINYYVKKFNSETKKEVVFRQEAIEGLVQYKWPGNVRQLENIVRDIVTTSKANSVTPDHPKIKGLLNTCRGNSIVNQIDPVQSNNDPPARFAKVVARLKGIERILNENKNPSTKQVAVAAGYGDDLNNRGKSINYSELLQTFFTSKIIAEYFEQYEEYAMANFPKSLDYMMEHHKKAINSCSNYSQKIKDFVLRKE